MKKYHYNPYLYLSIILLISWISLFIFYLTDADCIWKRLNKNSLSELVDYKIKHQKLTHSHKTVDFIKQTLNNVSLQELTEVMDKVSGYNQLYISDYYMTFLIYKKGMDLARNNNSHTSGFSNKRYMELYDNAKEKYESLIPGYIELLKTSGTHKDWIDFKNLIPEYYWDEKVYDLIDKAEFNLYWYPENIGWQKANQELKFDYNEHDAEYQICSDNQYYTLSRIYITGLSWDDIEEIYPGGKILMNNNKKDLFVKFHQVNEYVDSGYRFVDVLYKHLNTMARIDLMKRFLKYYPNGEYSAEAKNKIIELTVNDIMDREHGQLPKANPIRSQNIGGTSSITIKNDTNYGLTIYYSGLQNEMVYITSGNYKIVELYNGEYRIAAQSEASDVTPYAGIDEYKGGEYKISFYIKNL